MKSNSKPFAKVLNLSLRFGVVGISIRASRRRELSPPRGSFASAAAVCRRASRLLAEDDAAMDQIITAASTGRYGETGGRDLP
jgi:hypothetical protein